MSRTDPRGSTELLGKEELYSKYETDEHRGDLLYSWDYVAETYQAMVDGAVRH